MILPDVNVLVYAHRRESPDHDRYAAWLTQLVTSSEPFAFLDAVGASFVRIVTNARLWRPATSPETAVEFVTRLRTRRTCRVVRPGAESWTVFERLLAATGVRGPMVADAYLAAVAIEHGCVLATCDGDFARFDRLRRLHPLEGAAAGA